MTIQEMLQHADFIYYLEEAKYAEGLTPTLFISPAASDEILCINLQSPTGGHPGEAAIRGAVDFHVSQGMHVVVVFEAWGISAPVSELTSLSSPARPSQSPDRQTVVIVQAFELQNGRVVEVKNAYAVYLQGKNIIADGLPIVRLTSFEPVPQG
jgi:hypothetical protein